MSILYVFFVFGHPRLLENQALLFSVSMQCAVLYNQVNACKVRVKTSVCAFMCECVCICVCTCVCACVLCEHYIWSIIYACMYGHVCVYICVCKCAYVCARTCMCLSVECCWFTSHKLSSISHDSWCLNSWLELRVASLVQETGHWITLHQAVYIQGVGVLGKDT